MESGEDAKTLSGDEATERLARHEARTEVASAGAPRSVTLPETAPAALRFEDRYAREAQLGEGGMGVVESCLDRQIGRHVAMKRMRKELGGSDAHARFLREARVQGQLEHPAIVPVYDLSVAADGAVWFTMKRVRGVTLEQILAGLEQGASAGLLSYSRRKLLTAFSSVCLAVHYAHEAGVLHRDLKPGNIMLGDFGEVYVLDWGLARVQGVADLPPSERPLVDVAIDARTLPGDVLGTPGYMAPEQLSGDPSLLGPTADVYALGAILFELLALEPLHSGASLNELFASTLRGVDARPSRRAPQRDVPPELEQLVVQATALDPSERLGSARALHDALERFLDGERDVEMRREAAQGHASAALELAERARSEEGAEHPARRAAMREIGRALALDPQNEVALDTMVKLLAQPPRDLPAEVALEMAGSERHRLRQLGKIGTFAYLSAFLYLPLLVWCGVRDWAWVLGVYALLLIAAAVSFASWRARQIPDQVVIVVGAVSTLAIAGTAALLGPFLLTPMFLAVNGTVFALNVARTHRLIAAGIQSAALLLAIGLWLAGVLPGGYEIVPDGLLVRPGAIELPAVPTLVLLTLTTLGGIFTGLVPAGRVRDHLAATEQQLFVYAWHLRELVPEAVRGPTDPTGARRSRR